MRNPLNRRIRRDIKKEWKKYIVLFLLMTLMIATGSGIFVANDSMLKAVNDSYEDYNMEDGNFEVKYELTPELRDKIEEDITLYEQFYKTVDEDPMDGKKDETSVRIFKVRETVNTESVIEGRLPEKEGEIAIDRMHADNRSVKVGDKILVDGEKMTVTGLIALPDYLALYEDNAAFMFNAITFNVAVVTDEQFKKIDANECFSYAFKYHTKPADEQEEKEVSDKLGEKIAVLCATGGYTSDKDEALALKDDKAKQLELISYFDDINELKNFIPSYANSAMTFAREDMGKDEAMMNILVYIFIAVLAFVFAITTSNTITKEAAVIGTLRATGYTKRELIKHYMLMPVVVTLVSAIAGNLLGYTCFKDVIEDMYYDSYSLPAFETILSAKALVLTTVIPLILMLVINYIVIKRLMNLSPLRFLRRDLSLSKRKKAMRLPRAKFLSRFRMRIFLQNIGGYIVLFFGIIFVMLLLSFAIGLPETIDRYKSRITDTMIAENRLILKDYKDEDGNLIESSCDGAEKYSQTSLRTIDGCHVGEDITIYGYVEDSKYVKTDASLKEGEVLISSAYSDKFGLGEGDKITLKERYTDAKYDFEIKGVYDLPNEMCILMPNENFNSIFDLDEDAFTGFMSNSKIDDIDREFVYIEMTKEDMMSLAVQLDHSMGSMMDYLSVACLIIGVLVIYLLTKQIIEKNATSISMVKVLGYENNEINSLYVRSTTIVVIIQTILSAFVGVWIIKVFMRIFLNTMNGWFEAYISPLGFAKMILIMIASYLIVSFFDMVRIKRIPLTEALKNVE